MISERNEMKQGRTNYGYIFMLSVWGFAIVISSFLFLYVGYWLDGKFHTEPTFMIGLFLLGIFLCTGRLYWEAWVKKDKEGIKEANHAET